MIVPRYITSPSDQINNWAGINIVKLTQFKKRASVTQGCHGREGRKGFWNFGIGEA